MTERDSNENIKILAQFKVNLLNLDFQSDIFI